MEKIVLDIEIRNITEDELLEMLKLHKCFRVAINDTLLRRNEKVSLKKGGIIHIIEPIT